MTDDKAEQEDAVVIENLGKGKVNQGGYIYLAIEGCIEMGRGANYEDKNDRDKFFCAVKTLAAVLKPYTKDNKDYEAAIKEIKEKSATKSISTPDDYYEWWGLLQIIIHRSNLTPADEISILDGLEGDEDNLIIS
jgi:hypothetical protein